MKLYEDYNGVLVELNHSGLYIQLLGSPSARLRAPCLLSPSLNTTTVPKLQITMVNPFTKEPPNLKGVLGRLTLGPKP